MDKLTILIDESLKKKLKVYAAENDTNITRILIKYIKGLISNRNRKSLTNQ